MNVQAPQLLNRNPFQGLTHPDALWQQMVERTAQQFGITNMLYAFCHSRYTALRTGFTSSLFVRHNLAEDHLATFPDGLTLDDDIAAECVLSGQTPILWSTFDTLDLRPVQRARRELDKSLGFGTGVTFGLPFGGTSGFGGMCWALRHETAENFEALWQAKHVQMLDLVQQFDDVMRPAMVAQRFNITPREKDVLSYSAGGMSAKQIAEHLRLSTKTISHTLERARKKMESVSTMEAVAKALIYDLIG